MIRPAGLHLVEPSELAADGGSFSVTRTSVPSPRRRACRAVRFSGARNQFVQPSGYQIGQQIVELGRFTVAGAASLVGPATEVVVDVSVECSGPWCGDEV